MFEVSVIICSHNPKLDYLQRTLAALRAQTLVKDRWELLLVDNASKQPLASSFDISWHPNARHIAESELGLAPARQRGIREASAGLLIFVDDDNLLDPSYLSEALAISREWVRLGVFGSGSIVPEFECQPEVYLKKFIHYLAVRQNATDCWSNVIPCGTATPWGAGLCVRTEVARAYCELDERTSIRITDRRGQGLVSGQDVEISYVACSLGLGMGTFVGLKLTHLIPKERVQEGYLLRMVEGQELSIALLAYKWSGVIPRSPFSLTGVLSLAKTIFLRQKIDRRAHFASVRATIKARRIIFANEKKRQTDGYEVERWTPEQLRSKSPRYSTNCGRDLHRISMRPARRRPGIEANLPDRSES